ncbi:heavy metal translocating P-type ATPase [Cryobacterium fucosi]|uniref:Cadmium-translocating P-type ATPase n=1 Tax=Cryobacterium fucosi TaxID=1259157 RepID=A0A4R9B9J8_9MICO|nr:cation-translocating P-type ATPase [Cryobacterium fucosi]TFD78202.1 cadmium-translocating P-type ATPase [Cryobacterium fucosi]
MNARQSPASTLPSLMTRQRWIEVARIVFTGIISVLFWQQLVPVAVLWGAVAIGLYPLAKTGLIELIRIRKIGTEIFVTVATLVAVLGGEPLAGVVLMTIILIAEFIAELNTDRARASIKALIGSVPDTAILRDKDGDRSVAVAELKIGDVVLVRAGEKIPVDGRVDGGSAAVDESPITGESIPKDKEDGDHVFAGTILESGALDIRTEQLGNDTTFARIIALVEEAEESQAPVQKLADKVAAWLIPIVFVFLIVIFLITGDVRLIVTLLIFTSPAELGLATPLVIIAAISRAARNGVLVKGGIFLESLAKVDTIVFDKTGTLTENTPRVTQIELHDTTLSEQDVLALAASADRRSAHPLAKAIVDAASQRGIAIFEPTTYDQIRARGVKAEINNRHVLVGNPALLLENNVAVDREEKFPGETPIHIAVDGKLAGIIYVADAVRAEARETIAQLKATGVKRIIMLTGDNKATGKAIADQLGIDEVHAELLPEDKVSIIDRLKKEGSRVAMVGDGINDAPALARADVGIAMGGSGSQAALEAADVALMSDDLHKIVVARSIARRAYRTIQENLFVGVGVVHVLGITAALLGLIGPIQAALLHLGPDILVFVNSIKLLHVKIPNASK